MTTQQPLPMLPWVIVDPQAPDWSEVIGSYSMVRPAAELIRRHCSLIVGSEDLATIERYASDGRDTGLRLLREALRFCPVRVRGRGITEVHEMLACGDAESPAALALVPSTRGVVVDELARRNVSVLSGPVELLLSDYNHAVAETSRKMYAGGTDREIVWTEVLEPFTRAGVLNVHEGWIFSSLTWEHSEVESTGLYWFLSRLRERAKSTGTRMDVIIRGSFDRRDNHDQRAADARLRRNCAALINEFKPQFDLYLEVFKSPQAIHDRFMLARSASGASRLLGYDYPFITEAGLLKGRPFRSEVPKKRIANFTMDTRPDLVALREREWSGNHDWTHRDGPRRRSR